MAPRLIAFFGPDGTGKSTQAALLIDYFQSHNTKVRKVWIRSPHTLAFLLSRLFVKIGFYRTVSNAFGRKTKIPAVHTSRRLRTFWSVIELVSIIPIILFRVYIPSFLGYTLVAERYVVDSVVTIAYFTNNLNFLQSRTAKLLLSLIPKNTVFIHLDSDYSTILRRRHLTVEPHDFIEFQRTGYKIMENSLGAKLINTSNNSVKQTSMEIMQWLRNTQFLQSNHQLIKDYVNTFCL